MSETKHTPGPWAFCGLNDRWGIYPMSARNDGIDYFIATTRAVGDKAKEKANAQVMAAAPEMHATLTSLQTMLLADVGAKGGLTKESRERAIAAVRAALAAAEPPRPAAAAPRVT